MSRVRALVPEDIPRIVDLYATVFPPASGAAAEGLPSALHQVFFGHPWRDDRLPSLVCEDRTRRVIGCLGVMPRPMTMRGRSIRAAISHTFMVEPGGRSTLAGVDLVRRFLAGPQDVSVAQGSSRAGLRLLDAFGGSTSPLYSLRWTRPLRPGQYGLAVLKRRGLPAACAGALRPVGLVVDGLARRIRAKPFSLPESRLSGEELDADAWCQCLSAAARPRSLRPAYDPDSLKWLLAQLAQKKSRGRLQSVVARDGSGALAGWYLYYLERGGIGEVVQIGATRDSLKDVLEHLCRHAWRGGAVAVSGQLDVTALEAFSEEGCLFRHDGGPGLLIHSRHPDVLNAVHRGDAFIGRLEGEWWIGWLLNG